MRFLIDAQLPPALARFFRTSGHQCEHVSDVGLADADDEPIYRFAKDNEAVIVSKDEGFAIRKAFRPGKPAVVWVRRGNCSNRALIQWFEPLLPEILDQLNQGDDLVEVI